MHWRKQCKAHTAYYSYVAPSIKRSGLFAQNVQRKTAAIRTLAYLTSSVYTVNLYFFAQVMDICLDQSGVLVPLPLIKNYQELFVEVNPVVCVCVCHTLSTIFVS